MSEDTPSASPVAAPADRAAAPPAQTLEDRYRTGSKRRFDRTFAWSAVGVLVLAGIGFLVFSGWQTTNQVSAQDIGYTKTGELTLDMKFEVTAPAQTPVACAIEALNTSKATVGWTIVELPVTDERTTVVTTPLHTTTPATAVTAKECWILE
ncbi:DUF4307 domain-containing protein [Leucobacter rhizosphaerae]|uniref:DUF4307 domain-containing protein n=1 Tax=Leucobacter rhizosphaerae TaxID=2932245 RepID=A0ABY4FZC6_9MICO|nr:DUF4307 domain-containing protein [Leucobacter rhizosphaerae]UOQ61613.1 DUF4307 domain-containing protein [Leucobacter rhizosphaerae]